MMWRVKDPNEKRGDVPVSGTVRNTNQFIFDFIPKYSKVLKLKPKDAGLGINH
jgi:hypothetical protein